MLDTRKLNPSADFVEGDPLCYLPAEAIPPIAAVLSKGQQMRFRLTGKLVEIDGQTMVEVAKVELVR